MLYSMEIKNYGFQATWRRRVSLTTMPTADQLLAAAEVDENVPQVTDDIRERRHAAALELMLNEVEAKAKQFPGISADRLKEMLTTCPYFALVETEYPLVLNKAIEHPDELPTLRQMVGLIKGIEDGKLTQHSASVAAGSLLKSRYVDPVVKTAEPTGTKAVNYHQWKAMQSD